MIRLDSDKRAVRDALRREIRLLEKPAKDVDRKNARQERRERVKAIGKPAEGQRQPRVRNNAYLAFLRRQPCLNCNTPTGSDAAHIRFAPTGSGWRYVGKGEKPDDVRAVPLCRSCHTLQHSMSERRFWEDILGYDPVEQCAKYWARFTAQTPQHASSRAMGGGEETAGFAVQANKRTIP